jgi:hypothetical protein
MVDYYDKVEQTTIGGTGYANLIVGDKVPLTVSHSGDQNKKVTFQSDAKKICTVNKNGVVTGLRPGTATIHIETAENLQTDFRINVLKKVEKLTMPARANLKKGHSFTPAISTLPADTHVVWYSPNGTLQVDSAGKVTGSHVGYGTLNIVYGYDFLSDTQSGISLPPGDHRILGTIKVLVTK